MAAGEHLAKLKTNPTDIALYGFTKVKKTDSLKPIGTCGTDQIYIETVPFGA